MRSNPSGACIGGHCLGASAKGDAQDRAITTKYNPDAMNYGV
eukprot:CAMPEP_0184300748 /NCGR_PEP_ID=MMETSP1049-20130417/11113_1 /TAXON_ID=77928 /ORGANISM="Proteomonas sulcata, Strain CCMP704" /LENGTH=41 /DNA_ID= /DNA_START= /DNA_END= /DNA_ORIENTATION=